MTYLDGASSLCAMIRVQLRMPFQSWSSPLVVSVQLVRVFVVPWARQYFLRVAKATIFDGWLG